MSDWDWEIDGWMIVTGALCAAAAALLGNFLVLRAMSLFRGCDQPCCVTGTGRGIHFDGAETRGSHVCWCGCGRCVDRAAH